MIARGFKPVAWVAAIGGAALSCYMLSLQVASERAELAGIEQRILAARQDIRQLQTELGTRGRLQQLEQWNAEVLALSAPVSGQYVGGNVQLARFDVRQPAFPAEGEVRLAAAQTAPAAPTAASPRVVLASAQTSPVATPAPGQPLVRRASLTNMEQVPAPATARPAPPPAAAARSAPAPTRQASLLDDRTLRDLSAASRSERGGGTPN